MAERAQSESWFVATRNSLLVALLRSGPVPQHVALVMDGNRRFARRRHIETKDGHSAGFEAMRPILEISYAVGIPEVSVYAFSIENFNRSPDEVDNLMDIARSRLRQLAEHGELAERHGVKVRIIGNVDLLPLDVKAAALDIVARTADNKRAILNLCMPYTARNDIAHSIRDLVDPLSRSHVDVVTTKALERGMYTGECRPLDLLIRTSDTFRLSDFFLWEVVRDDTYIDFVPQLWPEYTPWHYFISLLRWGYAQWSAKQS